MKERYNQARYIKRMDGDLVALFEGTTNRSFLEEEKRSSHEDSKEGQGVDREEVVGVKQEDRQSE